MVRGRASRDAAPSNAGDVYHFLYAARRMVAMLHPRNGARLLVMESVSKGDAAAADPEQLLGVDLTEYYGAETAAAATCVEIVQVKYSALHPDEAWTVTRLTANRSGVGTSVFGKLARAYAYMVTQAGEARAAIITVRLQTNQPLDSALRVEWMRFRDALLGMSPDEGEDFLERETRSHDWLARFRRAAADRSPRELVLFFRSFHFDGFGAGMITDAGMELFRNLTDYTSESKPNVRNLIAWAQEHAIPDRSNEVRPEDVLGLLELRAHSFFPAPPELERPDDLFATAGSTRIAAAAEDASGGRVELLHGVAGVGKSSTLQLLAADPRFDVVIYDCWAGGRGAAPGEERFIVTNFLVQTINEIDALLQTNILASTLMGRRELAECFRDALTASVTASAARGRRFVLAVDAADDAAHAATESPLTGVESLVYWLWKLEWPDGCIVLVSSRTENLHRLGAPPGTVENVIEGFTRAETERLVREKLRGADDRVVDLMQRHTAGNPRVIKAVLSALPATGVERQLAFIAEHAREQAFDYYRDAAPARLRAREDRLLLTVLTQATPFPPVDVLASIVHRDPERVRLLLASLSFGVVIGDDDLVRWRNKDFHDFARGVAPELRDEAAALLADYSLRAFETCRYARANLSLHLYAAHRYERLLDFWMGGDRLERAVGNGAAGEDVLNDIRYLLLAAAQLRRHDAALRLLSFASDLVHGRSVFVAALRTHPEPAVEEGFADRYAAMLEQESHTAETRRGFFALAAALARKEGDTSRVRELCARGGAIRVEELLDASDVLALATVVEARDGLAKALESIAGESAFAGYAVPLLTRRTSHGDPDAAIRSASLDDPTRAHALLGLLDREDAGAAALDGRITEVLALAERGLRLDEDAVGNAVERLMRQGFPDRARALLPHWQVTGTRDRGWPWNVGLLRNRAAREALLGESFDPKVFYAFRMGGAHGAGVPDPFVDARRDAVALYPGYRVRALAWTGHPSARDEVRAFRERWPDGLDTRPFAANTTAANLVEAIRVLPVRDVPLMCGVLDSLCMFIVSARRDWEVVAPLAADPDWGRVTEEWLRRAMGELRPPRVRAEDAAAILVRLHDSARHVDRQLAAELFVRARMVAADADAGLVARIETVMAAANATARAGAATVDDVLDSAALLEAAATVDAEVAETFANFIVAELARLDVGRALALAAAWDNRGVLRPTEAIFSIAWGMSDSGSDPAATWPMARAAHAPGALNLVQRVVAAALDRGDRIAAGEALAACARVVKQQVDLPNHVLAARSFVDFARRHGLGDADVVREMEAIVARGEAAGIDSRDTPEGEEHADDPLVDLARNHPHAAAERMAALSASELSRQARLPEICNVLGGTLSAERIRQLVPVLQRLDPFASIQPLVHLLQAAGPASGAAEAIRSALRDAAPDVLRPLTHQAHAVRDLLVSAFSGDEFIGLIASTLAQRLAEWNAEDLQKWISYLVPLAGDARRSVFRFLLDRAARTLPPVPALPAVPERSPRAAVVHAMADLLAHPKWGLRWLAVHILVDLARSLGTEIYALLGDELEDTSHERWMTKHEWLLFTLEHLSLHEPRQLVPLLPRIVAQALDRELPHAKLREHARRIALSVEGAVPGTVSVKELEAINRPGAGLPPPPGFLGAKAHASFDSGSDLEDPSDPVELARVFRVPPAIVTQRRDEWIARWNVGGSADPLGMEDWWAMTSGNPREPLDESAKRHALLVVAGEWIDRFAVDEEEWKRWCRESLRRADPALPARLLGMPPLDEHYASDDLPEGGITAHELQCGIDPEWLMVAGHREFKGVGPEKHAVTVTSALVPRSRAAAVADAMASRKIDVPPVRQLHFTQCLTEFPHELVNATLETDNGMQPWLVQWTQGFGEQETDPLLPLAFRSYWLPDLETMAETGAVLDSFTLQWHRGTEMIFRHEYWHTHDIELNTSGSRLLARRDTVAELLARKDADLLLLVTASDGSRVVQRFSRL